MLTSSRKLLADGFIGLVVAVAMLVGGLTGVAPSGPSGSLRPFAVALAAVVVVALALRRRAPMSVLVVTNAVTALWYLLDYPGRLITVAALLAGYTVASERGWRWGTVGWLLTAAVSVLVVHGTLGAEWFDDQTINALALEVAVVALGTAVHFHLAFRAEVAERTERVARARAEQVRLQAAEQRLEIARELHDVFGHTMATVSVQAGVAAHVLDRQPEQAARALKTIKTISDEGLAEVQVLLGVLRPDGSQTGGGMDRLEALLEVTRSTGVRVDLTVDGVRRRLPPRADLAAFRIVQESMTNARRHADVDWIRVRLDYRPDALDVIVSNDGARRTGEMTPGGGHGIDGMRSRATSLGGTLTATATDGQFEVHCVLPTGER